MKKPIIAIDIDEVLLPHFEGLINWYNKEYDTQLTLIHNNPTDPRPWGTTKIPEAIKRVQRYFETDNFKKEQPFKEAVAVARSLSQSYDLIVVTARDEIIEQVTREWLDAHFSEIFRAAHFTAHYNLEGKSRSKIEVLQAAEAEYFIDDSLEHVRKAATAGIKCILFGDYPWNRLEKLPTDITRCKNWQEVLDYFNERG